MTNTICTASAGPNAQSQHHDLWVELARIEMAMEMLDGHAPNAAGKRSQLEDRRLQLTQTMQRLSE
ncbi:MAG TPA: hypothetical protein VFL78_03880 [Rhodanobacteraceae bacterium]|jgi:hypothetical protein|nr:hypothetical protein [Rhodanobacteraceae bacterium]